jgi:MFS family permease
MSTKSDLFKSKLKSNIKKYYLVTAFHSFIFAYVIERLFQQSRGLSVTEMVILDAIFMIVVLLLEVPSGAFADRWSRKKILLIGLFFAFFEFFVPIFANNFWMFAIASISAAIGVTLFSGTANALIYDSMKAIKEQKNFEKFLSREKFISYFSNGIAILIGGVIAYYTTLVETYWLSLFAIPIAFLIILTMTEPKIHTTTYEVKYWQHIKDAGKVIKNNKTLRFVILYGAIIGAIIVQLDEYTQLFYQGIGLPIILFGVVSIIHLILGGIGGFFAPYLKKKLSLDNSLLSILIISIICIVLAAVIQNIYSLIPLLFAFFVLGVVSPLVLGYLHHNTKSKHRATVESFQSLLMNGSGVIIGISFGVLSDYTSIFLGYMLLALFLFIYLLYYLITHKKSIF